MKRLGCITMPTATRITIRIPAIIMLAPLPTLIRILMATAIRTSPTTTILMTTATTTTTTPHVSVASTPAATTAGVTMIRTSPTTTGTATIRHAGV